MAERKLAQISQPALNNICTGKTSTCRASVRRALALLIGKLVTPEWLGGEGAIEEGILGPESGSADATKFGARDVQVAMLTSALDRAWRRDNPNSEFPMHSFGMGLSALLSATSARLLSASRFGTPWGKPPTPEQSDEFARHLARSLYVLMEPLLEGEQAADWPRLVRAAEWLERENGKLLRELELEAKSRAQRRGAPRRINAGQADDRTS